VTQFFIDFTTHHCSADTHASGEYNFSFTSLHAWVAGITRCPHLHMNSRSTHHCTAGAQESRTCAISPSSRSWFFLTVVPGAYVQSDANVRRSYVPTFLLCALGAQRFKPLSRLKGYNKESRRYLQCSSGGRSLAWKVETSNPLPVCRHPAVHGRIFSRVPHTDRQSLDKDMHSTFVLLIIGFIIKVNQPPLSSVALSLSAYWCRSLYRSLSYAERVHA